MSVINKKPFIVQVLETLTEEELVILKEAINGKGPAPVFRSLKPQNEHRLTVADKGIKPIKLELSRIEAQMMYPGYLIYNDTYCVVVSYSGMSQQRLTIIQVDTTGNMTNYAIKPCELSIVELRSELDDMLTGGGKGPGVLEVSDITALTAEELGDLKAGDVVIETTAEGVTEYEVNFTDATKLTLVHTDKDQVKEVVYEDNTYTGTNTVTFADKADLVSGKVPASQLPSYVDDVIEGYYYNGAFYEEAGHTTLITPEQGKIYVDVASGDTYRYTGSVYASLGSNVQIVQIGAMSGTLSDADYAKVAGNNCIIMASTQLFRKAFDASTLYIYQAFSRQAGQNGAVLEYINITKNTKEYELVSDNIVEANPVVPEGTTPTDLTGLKIGAGYYKTALATFVDWS